MSAPKRDKKRVSLTMLFTCLTFCILLLSVAVAGAVIYGLARLPFFPIQISDDPDILTSLLLIYGVSLIVGALIATVVVRIPLRPINWMIAQMNRLAEGDFKARLHFEKPLGSIPAFAGVERSFNKMAEELGNTEVLRSDFINNFSHEFKTPIVSIAGFAKLLQKGNLDEGQKKEYLDAIVEESMRLSCMATNVLNLTKVENQSILTDVTQFNLSEQIRSAVLLLESSWAQKHLEIDLEFPEVTICASEELLKQVWINLLHNAVKFSPEYGPLQVKIQETRDTVSVSVINAGSIAPEYDRMCLVNDAVYIARYDTVESCQKKYGYVPSDVKEYPGEWTATGKQFAVPYVFKTLFSHEDILFEDMCETFSVSGALYLDMNEALPEVEEAEKALAKLMKGLGLSFDELLDFRETGELPEHCNSVDNVIRLKELLSQIDEGHDYHFVGKVGQFTPILKGCGGGILLRESGGKYYAATGSKGYRWMESEMVRTLNLTNQIDRSFYKRLVDDAVEAISKYGDFEWFVDESHTQAA